MDSNEHRLLCADIALDDGDVGLWLDRGLVAVERKGAEFGRELDRAGCALDELFVLAPMGDEVGDRNDLEAVVPGELKESLKAHHRAVLIQNLASHADGLESC